MDDNRLLMESGVRNHGWAEEARETKSAVNGRHQGLVPGRHSHTQQDGAWPSTAKKYCQGSIGHQWTWSHELMNWWMAGAWNCDVRIYNVSPYTFIYRKFPEHWLSPKWHTSLPYTSHQSAIVSYWFCIYNIYAFHRKETCHAFNCSEKTEPIRSSVHREQTSLLQHTLPPCGPMPRDQNDVILLPAAIYNEMIVKIRYFSRSAQHESTATSPCLAATIWFRTATNVDRSSLVGSHRRPECKAATA